MQWISLIGLVVAFLGLFFNRLYKYRTDVPSGPNKETEVDIKRYSKYANLSKYIGGIAGIFFLLTLILRYMDTSRLDTQSLFFGGVVVAGSILFLFGFPSSFFSGREFSDIKEKIEKGEGDAIELRAKLRPTRIMQLDTETFWCIGLLLCMVGIWYGIWPPV